MNGKAVPRNVALKGLPGPLISKMLTTVRYKQHQECSCQTENEGVNNLR